MNVRVDLDSPIRDGMEVVFRTPCDASEVTGLNVYYPVDGVLEYQNFTFADANAKDLGHLDALFAKDAVVKVILDLDTYKAFVQNADTNAYLEGRFADLEQQIGSGGGGGGGGGASVDDVIEELEKTNLNSLTTNKLVFHDDEPTDISMTIVDGNTIVFYDEVGGDDVILRGVKPGAEDTDAVNKGQLDNAVGNIESALDHIIEIQNSLIGGEA